MTNGKVSGATAKLTSRQGSLEDTEPARRLRGLGVEFSERDIPLETINDKASRRNQARAEAILAESVERFAAGYRQGDVLPPIVVYRSGSQFVILDGNNRVAAARRVGLRKLPGLVVADDTSEELLVLFTVMANTRHGVTPELDWRAEQVAMLRAREIPVEQVAKAMSMSENWVVAAEKVVTAGVRSGARGWEELSFTVKQVLAGIHSDVVLREAVRVAATTKMGAQPARQLAREIRAQRSEADQLAVVSQTEEQRRAEAKANTRRLHSYKMQTATALGHVAALDAGRMAVTFRTPEEARETHKRCEQAVETLFEVMAQLEAVIASEE